jgi:hypothetical protein
MAWTISKVMESFWLATQTQTRHDVLLIGRSPQGVFWVGVRTCFLVQPEIEVSFFEFHRAIVYDGQSGQLQGHLAL